MDARLKERLVGAAVLVALGVWLIPWVLDGPDPEQPAEALVLPAAESEQPVRTQTIDLADRERAPAPAPGGQAPGGNAREPKMSPEVTSGGSDEAAADVIEPEPAPSGPAPSGDSTAPGLEESPAWFVQLGSFGEQVNAERLAQRVSTYGYTATVSDYRSGGRTMHRVRVGPSSSRNEAESVASSLSAHGFIAQVVSAN